MPDEDQQSIFVRPRRVEMQIARRADVDIDPARGKPSDNGISQACGELPKPPCSGRSNESWNPNGIRRADVLGNAPANSAPVR